VWESRGEGTSRSGITARNVTNAKEFRIHKGALIRVADEPHFDSIEKRKKDDTFARWPPSDRSAPYVAINARYQWKRSFPSGVSYGVPYHNVTVPIDFTACDQALVIRADCHSLPEEGNSQVFRASRWNWGYAGNTTLDIFSLYAEKRILLIVVDSKFPLEGQATPRFSQSKIEAVRERDGTRFGMEAFSEGKSFMKCAGVSKELAFGDDYGIPRAPRLRICLCVTESPNRLTSTVSITRIEANGKWDPPYWKPRKK